MQQQRSNKRVFDTENALKGTFNGWWGKWQTITYLSFVFSYAIIMGWIYELPNYTSNAFYILNNKFQAFEL